MTLLILFCVASAIFGVGWAVGFALGRQTGSDEAYRAVNRYYEERGR